METCQDVPEGANMDEEALKWFLKHVKPDQWQDIARALKLVQINGGFGKITLVVRDGRIADHPKAELSL